jgi:hypothetical protein
MSDEAYGGQPPHQKHSETSIAAAISIKRAIGPLHNRVIGMLRDYPATDEEMIDHLGIVPNTLRPRRRELELMGIVVNTGEKRLTKSGRKAFVWGLAKRGNVDAYA